jgi:hypothetical protein
MNNIKMKMLTVILLMSIVACKNNTPTTTSNTEEKNPTASDVIEPNSTPVQEVKKVETKIESVNDSLYRMVIMFYSTGEGVETEFIKAFEEHVKSFSIKVGKNVSFEKTAWGREGETDYCLRLEELTPAERENFMITTRDLFKKARWVNIYENYKCLHLRK